MMRPFNLTGLVGVLKFTPCPVCGKFPIGKKTDPSHPRAALPLYRRLMWIIVLLVQSIPYCCALIVAIVGAFPQLSAKLVGSADFGVVADIAARREGGES